MPVVKWDPFRNVNALQERVNRMFDETFPRPAPGQALSAGSWNPAVDIHQTSAGIVITADLPGVTKEAVSVEVRNNILILKGERPVDPGVKKDQYLCKERPAGSFQRFFNLKSTVPPETIRAAFKDGVLTILVPRPEEEKPKQIRVNVA